MKREWISHLFWNIWQVSLNFLYYRPCLKPSDRQKSAIIRIKSGIANNIIIRGTCMQHYWESIFGFCDKKTNDLLKSSTHFSCQNLVQFSGEYFQNWTKIRCKTESRQSTTYTCRTDTQFGRMKCLIRPQNLNYLPSDFPSRAFSHDSWRHLLHVYVTWLSIPKMFMNTDLGLLTNARVAVTVQPPTTMFGWFGFVLFNDTPGNDTWSQ